ncbi:purine-nucleoside phosphorylase [Marinoscillum sp. MHG1-6]|uniref:purine-nucleoside phosphorylase n=1 Tax=Marinoscillum sp. MHG1-6 TaxID=2959627 RepID=UPI002157D750|nr:purine-nucleoside phosphorylase [Marinoscillum sp. MHG1-6]
MLEKVEEACAFLKNHGYDQASIAIILGTGLGGLVNEINIEKSIDYKDIPYFPISTVESHSGKLILGTIGSKKVIAMQGRFHYYEGYSMDQVVFPVRVLKWLGVSSLFISNAAGCMNLTWNKGELMLITDHINLQPENPLRGVDSGKFGPIFTDMSEPYDPELNDKIMVAANKLDILLNKGVYVAVPGPSLETKAEYRFLRNAGADVVGMSTVPEVIAANQMGLRVAAISVLTDDCDPDNLQPINIQEILETAAIAEKSLISIIKEVVVSM